MIKYQNIYIYIYNDACICIEKLYIFLNIFWLYVFVINIRVFVSFILPYYLAPVHKSFIALSFSHPGFWMVSLSGLTPVFI